MKSRVNPNKSFWMIIILNNQDRGKMKITFLKTLNRTRIITVKDI